MSNLGKILMYVALAGAIVAGVFGVLLIGKYNDTKTNLTQSEQAKQVSDAAAKQAKAEALSAAQAKADAEAELSTATTKVNDLTTQLTAAQKTADEASTALKTATDAAKTAQDNLDKIKATLGDQTAEQIIAAEKKAEADLAASQSEQKILQDQVQASQVQIADLTDAINRSKVGKMPPGVSGKVTFVNRTWNFVVLDVGLANGVVPNGELIVYRGRDFLGKVKVTSVEANSSVADILPDAKSDIQVGDYVLN